EGGGDGYEAMNAPFEARRKPARAYAGAKALRVRAGEGVGEGPLEGKRLHDLDRADRLDRGRGHGAVALPLLPRRLLDEPAQLHGPDPEERSSREREDGELPPQPEHEPDHPEERSEEHTSELQSRGHLVCRLL